MKKNTLSFALVLLVLLITSLMIITVQPIQAADTVTGRLQNVGVAAGYNESTSDTSLATTVGQIIKVFISILGLIFLSYTVYAGFLWLTAGGEEEKIKKAQAIIRSSIIGLAVALSAYIITATVVDRFSKAANYQTRLPFIRLS